MPKVRTRITVAGFKEAEARAGIPHLLNEFRQRPWLLAYQANWDAATSRLVVFVETEAHSVDVFREAHFDEVWDCIVACFVSESGLAFDIEESRVVDPSSQ